MEDCRVVIVGCGISGIGAAHRLLQAGFKDVRILEATGRSGGRIRTTGFGKGLVEIGANWIHGPSKKNPVFQLACHYRLLDDEATSEENQAIEVGGHLLYEPIILCSSGEKLSRQVVEPMEQLYLTVVEKSREFFLAGTEPVPSVGEFMRREIAESAKKWRVDTNTEQLRLALLNMMLKLECCISGTHSMNLVGLGAYGQYDMLPGLDCTFPGGYEGLTDALMKSFPKGTVSYNRPVKCIHWMGSYKGASFAKRTFPVLVECENRETVPADHVIVTVPLGFLKQHYQSLFQPQLPFSKAHSIQKMGFGTNNKIFLEFEEPFWEPDCQLIELVWEGESPLVSTTPNLRSDWIKKLAGFTVLQPPERYGHVICGWIAGHESEFMETLSDDEVSSCVTQVLRRFTASADTVCWRSYPSDILLHYPWCSALRLERSRTADPPLRSAATSSIYRKTVKAKGINKILACKDHFKTSLDLSFQFHLKTKIARF
ncbi:peroxisomal N(1)-acetyl-spermine/spermidine oxidase isoform X2 [Latimeria chalumnae]|uniref:peroxisomal N(1)-acetyl-spermine/spermidine oxidase isoform X2 n=1 Tax=Latimeria chalumnae TaxID=7897 RepID=UPI00313E4F9F